MAVTFVGHKIHYVCDTEAGRASIGHTLTLAVALQDVNPQAQQICFDVPAGYYYKLRNGGTGTHTESYVSGQKTIFG